jgi:large subunit ribosomal protein L15
VARASQQAIKTIESVGGKITCKYFNKLALRATIKPEKFWKIPKFAAPMKQRDIGKCLNLFLLYYLLWTI